MEAHSIYILSFLSNIFSKMLLSMRDHLHNLAILGPFCGILGLNELNERGAIHFCRVILVPSADGGTNI